MKDKELRSWLEYPDLNELWRVRRLELIVKELCAREGLTIKDYPLASKVILRPKCDKCGK